MEQPLLYLDTARLGRMTPTARQAQLDFTCLASHEGGSARFDQFLRFGVDTCFGSLVQRYPGLSQWRGLAQLRGDLRRLANSDPGLPVLFANRSAQLMKLATRLLFHPCRHVLVTDVGWPPYHDMLRAEATASGRAMTMVAVRECLLRGDMNEEALIALIRDRFVGGKCDGLFLTAVGHLGLRLPVERIVRSLEAVATVRFVVVDGAQDFCHASLDLRSETCDLYLTGCHKWLGAYHPMGLGFFGRRQSCGVIETILTHLIGTRDLDDPLLRFAKQLEGGTTDGWMETITLAPLFSCQGAVADALDGGRHPGDGLCKRQARASDITIVAQACGWEPHLPAESFRTGILLLQAERAKARQASAQELRGAFCDLGVALTAYDNGIIRLSMPGNDFQPCDVSLLKHAFLNVA